MGVSVDSGSEGPSPTVGMKELSSLAGEGMSTGFAGSCAGRGGSVCCATGRGGGPGSSGACLALSGIAEWTKGRIFRKNWRFLLVIVLEPSILTV